MIEVRVPATSANLGPGFDVLALALTLYDTIRFFPREDGFSIDISGEGADDLPRDENNLVVKAARHFLNQTGYTGGFHVELVRKIPLARGLGSSAAAIVGGLLGAWEIAGRPHQREALFQAAAGLEGHPDNVAAAFSGGLTIAYQAEGKFAWVSVVPSQHLKVVVLVPDYVLTTAEARQMLPDDVARKDAVFNLGRLGLLLAALLAERPDLLREATKDRLHQPHRGRLLPGFDDLCQELNRIGVGVALSGAGPSLIAFIEKKEETRLMEQIKRLVANSDANYTLLPLEIDLQGAQVSPLADSQA